MNKSHQMELMKNPLTTMKRLLLLLLMGIIPHFATSQTSTGSNCSIAPVISNGAEQKLTSSTTQNWVRFVPTQSSHEIVVYLGIDTLAADADSVYLYSGSCSGLTLIQSIKFNSGERGAAFMATSLVTGNTYYLKVTRKVCNTCTLPTRYLNFYVETSSSVCADKVKNGSFESNSNLPSCATPNDMATYTVGLADHWTTPYLTINDYFNHHNDQSYFQGSSDYFNTSSGNIGCLNFTPDPRTGNGHAGFAFTSDQSNGLNYQEYIVAYDGEVTPVVAGRQYVISYYVKRKAGNASCTFGVYYTGSFAAVAVSGTVANGIETPVGNGWSRIDCYITPNVTGYILFGLMFTSAALAPNQANYFFVDDVSMYESVTISTNANTTICQGNDVIGTFQTSGASSYSWSISPNTATITPSGASCTATAFTAPGTYTLTVSGITPGGCSSSASVLINVLPTPTVTISPAGPITFCAGQSQVLTATASPNVSYQWYLSQTANGQGAQLINGATTNTVLATSSGYYIATVVNSSGCIWSASVHVIVNATPQVAILASADENCPDANDGSILSSVTSGTPPFSYSWTTTPVQTTALASGLNSGTYTVTVTDANGCIGQASSSVGAVPLPPAPIIAASNTNLCSSTVVTYTITNYSSGTVYNASYSTTPTSVTQPAAGVYVVDWGQSGSDVTFTVTADAGSGNPICVQTTSIMVPACCGIYGMDEDALMTGLPGSKTSYDLYNNYPAYVTGTAANFTYSNPNGILYINGDFIVPSNCTLIIDASQVRFGADAAIYLMSNAYLMISNSHLAAGCNNMWDGMYIDPTAQLFTQKSSLIEDAKHAVVSVGGGYYHLYETIFNKNRIGVDVKNFNNAHPGYIANCVFTCRDLPGTTVLNNVKGTQNTSVFIQDYPVSAYSPSGMLPPYNKQRSWAGVYCNSVGNTSIGANYQVSSFGALTVGDPSAGYQGLNIFDYLDYGVYAHYSNIIVQNNAFQYITGPTTLSKGGDLYGIAVYAETFSEQDNEWVAHVGNINDEHNTFYECGRGVDLSGYYENVVTGNFYQSHQVYSPVVSSTLPTTGSYANFVKTGYYINVDISHNDIVNWANGIVFYSDYLTAGPGHYYQLQGDATIMHNRISPMEADNQTPATEYVSTAIVAQNIIPSCNQCTSYGILGRVYVDQNDLNNVFNGIVMQSWLKAPRAADNIISLRYQAPYQMFKFPQTGIRSVSNQDDVIYRNIITGDAQVLTKTLARGIYSTLSPGADVRCNIITSLGQCVVFESNCMPTTFFANEMNASIDGYVLLNNGKIGAQGSYANAAYPNGQTCDNLWYGPFSHAATFTDNTYTPDQHSPLYVRGNSLAAYIPTSNLTTSLFPIADSYLAANAINVVMTPAPFTDCSQAPQLAEGGGGDGDKEKQIKLMEKIATGELENAGYADQAAWADQKTAYLALRSDSTLMDTSIVLQSFYADAAQVSVGQLVLADEKLATNDLSTGAAITAAVVTTTIADENIKTVNELFALVATGQSLSESQTGQLEAIADQCAPEGGEGVYRARVLLGVLNNNYVQYEDTCLPPPSNQRRSNHGPVENTSVSAVKVFPNPSTGLVNIAVNIQATGAVYFVVRDLTGREVFRKQLGGGYGLWSVDLSALSVGAYQYTIVGGEQLLQTDRIVITR